MSAEFDNVIVTAVKSQEQSVELMEKLLAVAQPSAVYSPPLVSGDYTLITASEVYAGMGFGFGIGGGTAPKPAEGTAMSEEEPEGQAGQPSGVGGGGGGGGASMGRPVAVISIGPEGVQVEPVVDATKVALAFFTTLGSMLFMLGRMRRASRR